MDVNFAPASGHKPQQLQAMAFDLYNGPTTFQQLRMRCSVRSQSLLGCLLHLVDTLGHVKSLGQEPAH